MELCLTKGFNRPPWPEKHRVLPEGEGANTAAAKRSCRVAKVGWSFEEEEDVKAFFFSFFF